MIESVLVLRTCILVEFVNAQAIMLVLVNCDLELVFSSSFQEQGVSLIAQISSLNALLIKGKSTDIL